MTRRQALGKWGENHAAEYLADKGYCILSRNLRTPYGEIDLLACLDTPIEGKVYVFVEVKTRRSISFGYPEESINQRKKDHLISAIQYYLQGHPEIVDGWRVDVISILVRLNEGQPGIMHFENVLHAE